MPEIFSDKTHLDSRPIPEKLPPKSTPEPGRSGNNSFEYRSISDGGSIGIDRPRRHLENHLEPGGKVRIRGAILDHVSDRMDPKFVPGGIMRGESEADFVPDGENHETIVGPVPFRLQKMEVRLIEAAGFDRLAIRGRKSKTEPGFLLVQPRSIGRGLLEERPGPSKAIDDILHLHGPRIASIPVPNHDLRQRINAILDRRTPAGTQCSVTLSRSLPPLLLALTLPWSVTSACREEPPTFQARTDIVRPPSRTVTVHFQDDAIRGSGLLLRDGRHVITNLHVVRSHLDRATFAFESGTRVAATLVTSDPTLDLALFRMARDLSADPEPIPLCEATGGKSVYAIGAPYGLPTTVLRGYVGHPDRTGLDKFNPEVAMIQVHGVTYPGTSGAPIYCESGGLLGINRAAFGYGTGSGLGLAIPAAAVRALLKRQRLWSGSF